MGELIDISGILAVRREVAEYDREQQKRILTAFERIRPILLDLKTVFDAMPSPLKPP